MQFWKYSLPILAGLLSVVTADEDAIASSDSAVVKLTADKFESFMSENPLVLAEFFAPWCGHCKKLGPEFSAAADVLEDKNIKLAQIDCTEEGALCESMGIRGYPTLKVFRGDKDTASDYEGTRKSDGIVSYMLKQAAPPVTQFEDGEALTDFIAEQTEAFVLQVLPKSVSSKSTANSTYHQLANGLRETYTFVSTDDESFVEKYSQSAKEPTYLVFRPYDDEPSVFTDPEFSADSLEAFIATESVPFFGEITQETYTAYTTSKVPLAYYFYDSADQRSSVAKTFTDLGKEYRGIINFVGLDATLYGRHASNLNMPEEFPFIAIHDLRSNLKYGTADPTTDEITEFIEKFNNGELEAIIKSQPIPTEEELSQEAVVKMVGYTHDAIVNDNTKDVLVKYYAPWCGHCKRLAPIFEDLASLYAANPEAKDKIVIGKLDHQDNDVNVAITGYPTLVLYPANGEIDEETGLRKGIVYNDRRELENMAQFIFENGGNHFDILSTLDNETVEEIEEAEETVERDEF